LLLHPFILGQIAFAIGMNKSPAFDSCLALAIAGKCSAGQQRLIDEWEAGWDAARRMKRELRLENQKFIKSASRVQIRT